MGAINENSINTDINIPLQIIGQSTILRARQVSVDQMLDQDNPNPPTLIHSKQTKKGCAVTGHGSTSDILSASKVDPQLRSPVITYLPPSLSPKRS
jgi:hypothetical protein